MDENIPESKERNWTSIAIWACIGAFFAIVIILALSGTNLGAALIKIVYGFKNLFGPEWSLFMVLLAVFLISIFGNLTVIFPVPYTIALGIVTILPEFNNPFNLILLSIISGFGAGLGEVSAYLLGRGGAKTIEDTSYGKSLENLKSKVERGWAIPLMLLFAATPVPDDPLLIVLGIVSYSLTRMTVVYIFGKITFCLYIAVLIRIAIANPAIANLMAYIGLDINAIRIYDWTNGAVWLSSVDPLSSAIVWISVLVFIILIIFVDWKALFKKFGTIKEKLKKE